MPLVYNAGVVDRQHLDTIRPHLAEAHASEALAALSVYDFCYTHERRLMAFGHEAHRQPQTARRRHHDLWVHDLLARRFPDDRSLWDDVCAADAALLVAQARYAAAAETVTRAGTALGEALDRSWPVLLPYTATKRPYRPEGLLELSTAFAWPLLTDPPGVETANEVTAMRFKPWWPLSVEPVDHRRRDRTEWEEWAWGELAEGHYTSTADTITLTGAWSPPTYPSTTDDGTRQRLAPMVVITPARVRSFEEQIARKK